MSNDLTWQDLNNQLGETAFSVSGNLLVLDMGKITGDTYTSVNDKGVVEACFKLLRLGYETQEAYNVANPDTPLTSFSSPFYGSIQETSPPVLEASATVSGVVPLDIDQMQGIN